MRLHFFFVLAALASISTGARAYTVSSLITRGCHEEITTDALREVRLEFPLIAAPLVTSVNDSALIGDLQFTPADDMRDLGGASLLIGMRDNDLKGKSSTDLSQLAVVQGDPTKQEEHCLRGPDDKEPTGTQTTVAKCQAFILQRFGEAIATLDANGVPDRNQTIRLPIHLAIRGDTVAVLPTFYVRMGQALHAVEDSFAHSYRTPDGTKITVSLDWLDEATSTVNEETDGPSHRGQLDVCTDPDDLRKLRHQLAVDTATRMLRAALDPSLNAAGKMAAAQGIIDDRLAYQPGCNFANKWCAAPEEAYGNTSLISCSSTGAQSRAWLGWAAALIFLATLFKRRRKVCP
jgi:MYXO-CTERM domain-containing protein